MQSASAASITIVDVLPFVAGLPVIQRPCIPAQWQSAGDLQLTLIQHSCDTKCLPGLPVQCPIRDKLLQSL